MLLMLLTLVLTLNAVVDLSAAAIFQAFYAGQSWMPMVVLVLLLSSLKATRLLGDRTRSMLGEVAVLSSAAIFGPVAAVIAAAAHRASHYQKESGGWSKYLYNVAACVSAANTAGYATKALIPSFGFSTIDISSLEMVLAMGIYTSIYFVLLTALSCAYDAIANQASLFSMMKSILLGTWLRYFLGGASALAAFFVLAQLDFNYALMKTIESPQFRVAATVVMMLLTLHQIIFNKVHSANPSNHATQR